MTIKKRFMDMGVNPDLYLDISSIVFISLDNENNGMMVGFGGHNSAEFKYDSAEIYEHVKRVLFKELKISYVAPEKEAIEKDV